jgi:hypothetical protein
MFIESKLKRHGGSHITMADGTTYHFAPDPTGRHVAMVTRPEHIERLLSITEGFGLPKPDASAPAIVAPIGAKAAGTPTEPTQPTEPTEPTQPTEATQPTEPAQPAAPADTAMNRAALEALYIKATGKKPHPAAKDATLLTAIKAAREA